MFTTEQKNGCKSGGRDCVNGISIKKERTQKKSIGETLSSDCRWRLSGKSKGYLCKTEMDFKNSAWWICIIVLSSNLNRSALHPKHSHCKYY